MKQDLLNLYNEELSYLNKMCVEFSKKHPRIASNLKLGPKHQADPLINHLVESFSFISANIRKQLQDDNEDLAQMLIDRIFPQYLKPVPSASIIKLLPDKNAEKAVTISKGTRIAAEYNNNNLMFNSVYNTEILPLKIINIDYQRNLSRKKNISKTDEKAYIDIELELNKDVNLETFELSSLQLHINTDAQYTPKVYELLLNKYTQGHIFNNENEEAVNKISIKPIGLADNESLVPYDNVNRTSYELVGEYFTFPLKFQFIQLQLENKQKLYQHLIKIRLYVNEYDQELANHIDRDSLLLNCTPIINLYKTKAEPIYYDSEEHEYLIKINPYMKANYYSVYSICSVKLILEDNTSISILPFSHESNDHETQIYWHERRSVANDEILREDGRQNVYISLIDQAGEIAKIENATIHIEVLATNHKLATKLLINNTELSFWEEHTNEVCKIELLHAFSPPNHINEKKSNQWKLLSHLNHSQISLGSNNNNKNWLIEMLSLYNNVYSNECNNILNTIDNIQCKTVNKRHPGSPILGYCQGSVVEITINEEHLLHHEIYQFISILSIHLQKSCMINSFIETKIINLKNETLAYWPAKLGSHQWI
jgi:type VI secretion system protein ImpG